MRRTLIALPALALALVACASASGGSAESGIFGRAVIGGPCPVALEAPVACREHPVRATVVVMRAGSGKRVATLRSGRQGRFRKALAPGTYRLVPRPRGDAVAVPKKIHVPAGSFIRVTIRYRITNR